MMEDKQYSTPVLRYIYIQGNLHIIGTREIGYDGNILKQEGIFTNEETLEYAKKKGATAKELLAITELLKEGKLNVE